MVHFTESLFCKYMAVQPPVVESPLLCDWRVLPTPMLNYSEMYRAYQLRRLLSDKTVGPLGLFDSEVCAFPLFIAYAAASRPFVRFPVRWRLADIAYHIYEAALLIDAHKVRDSHRLAASAKFNDMLRYYRLPGLSPPPLKVPSALAANLPHLRRVVLRSLS